jgi:hypothetical protein
MLARLAFLLLIAALSAFSPNLGSGAEPQKFNLEASADFDYDTNTTQQSNLPADLVTTGQRGSMVYSQTLKLQYELNPQGPLNLQGKYEFFQNFHARASFVDTMIHTWTLTPSYLLGSSRNIKVWLPFSFNYTDVGSDKYFTFFGLAPNLFHRFSQTMGYGVEVRFGRRYGWLPQVFPQFYDYTSRDIGASLGYYYFLANGGYLQARLSYDYVGAQGSNNDASRYSILVSGEYPFTSRLSLLLYLDLAYLDADHSFRQGQLVIINPNLPPGTVILVPPEPTFPQRRDKNVLFGAIGTVKIYRGLQGSLHYYFTRHDSNLAVYDYTSHIFGAQIAYKY